MTQGGRRCYTEVMTDNLPDLKDVVAKVRELATNNPDYVYDRGENGKCQYIKDGEGSCIVGQAYVELGVPVEYVKSWDSVSYGNAIGAWQVVEREYENYSKYDKEWLDYVQECQDLGQPWELAVDKADAKVKESRRINA